MQSRAVGEKAGTDNPGTDEEKYGLTVFSTGLGGPRRRHGRESREMTERLRKRNSEIETDREQESEERIQRD